MIYCAVLLNVVFGTLILYNLNVLFGILSPSTKCSIRIDFFLVIYAIAVVCCPLLENDFPHLWVTPVVVGMTYISLAAYLISTHKKLKRLFVIYVYLTYLVVDSIIESILRYAVTEITEITNDSIFPVAAAVISNLILLFLLKIVLRKSKSSPLPTFDFISKKTYLLILLALFFGGSLIENQLTAIDTSEAYVSFSKTLTVINIVLLVFTILTLIFNCLLKSYYSDVNSLLEKQITKQLDYYQSIERLNEEIRRFRHDYKNHMICLKSLLDNGNVDDAKQYISEITYQNIINPTAFFTGNNIADAILSDNAAKAGASGIKIEYNGSISEDISPADLCTVLSNAVDNAVEACGKMENAKERLVRIECAYMKGVQIIRVGNPVKEDFDINDGLISTSKSDKQNHGYGLFNIKKTVEKLDGEMNISCKDKWFTMEISFRV